MQAVKMYLEDGNYRRSARLLQVAPQTVVDWVAHYTKTLKAQGQTPPQPLSVETAQRDELYTFVGAKKRLYLVTQGDRATRRFLAFKVSRAVDWDTLQAVVDAGVIAGRYYSDGYAVYPGLIYPCPSAPTVAPGKTQTYSVEAGNAELRHYLARLSRRNRCFSRQIEALAQAVWLFVYAWSTWQLRRRKFPSHKKHLIECLPAIK